jgi:hypothetical protein
VTRAALAVKTGSKTETSGAISMMARNLLQLNEVGRRRGRVGNRLRLKRP